MTTGATKAAAAASSATAATGTGTDNSVSATGTATATGNASAPSFATDSAEKRAEFAAHFSDAHFRDALRGFMQFYYSKPAPQLVGVGCVAPVWCLCARVWRLVFASFSARLSG